MRLNSAVSKCLFVALLFVSPVFNVASVVQQVTLEQMLKNSELVFEGTVVGLDPHVTRGGAIETDIAFRVNDVIVGSFSEAVIVLTFSGGTVGNITEKVSDLHMPEYREHGVYFVESLHRKQVHPFYGWDQGHFIVKSTGPGMNSITTRDGQPVVSLQTGKSRTGEVSNGIAVGIETRGAQVDPRTSSLTLEQFKQNLRRVAESVR